METSKLMWESEESDIRNEEKRSEVRRVWRRISWGRGGGRDDL